MIFDFFEYMIGIVKVLTYKCIYFKRLYIKIPRVYHDVFIRLKKGAVFKAEKGLVARSNLKVRVEKNARLEVGSNVSFNDNCFINCMKKIKIGDNCMFGQNVSLYDHDHDYNTEGTIKENGFLYADIEIGNNVWIGSNCVVLRGTKISDNVVIGAGTVVKGKINVDTVNYAKSRFVTKSRVKCYRSNNKDSLGTG